MEVTHVMEISVLVGVVSIVLAVVAIAISWRSENRSRENYERTKEALTSISTKAEVIEKMMDSSQAKLIDTVTRIAAPVEDTNTELLKQFLPMFVQNPGTLSELMKLAELSKKEDDK